jgi:pheromone alpha factor receptor
MADASSTDAAFDVFTQVFTLIGSDGVTEIPVFVDLVDEVFGERFVVQANYGSQIGATIVMLLAYLLMTPATKFRRAPTVINILALVFNVIRCVLLAWFPTSEWFEFYTLFSGDYSHVPVSDYTTSVAATVFTIPVIILIEAALVVQAWAMIQLWPPVYKYTSVVVSVIVALAAVALKFASSISQALAILYPVWPSYSVRKADLAFSTASIFWFCFLFNVRLAMHMWTHRSILPSVKGMSAMEILVITNGVLMLVPGKCHPTSPSPVTRPS